MKGYVINKNYLNGWKRDLRGFFFIMMVFFCLEPILTSWIKSEITPLLLQCNEIFLWGIVALAYVWLIAKAWSEHENQKYVSLRSYFIFVLPLYCIIQFYGIVIDIFPSIVFSNGMKVSSVLAITIPMGLYTASVLSCCYKERKSTSFFKKYKYNDRTY